MHRLNTSFILAYHGCDDAIARDLLNGKPFKSSQNDYDWLGHGIYFWEANPKRGLDWAMENARRTDSRIKHPAVVGAIIDLRFCLDLTTSTGIQQITEAHASLLALYETAGKPRSEMPKNDRRKKLHNLDCAVVNALHDMRKTRTLTPIDTVKGAFLEGEDVYESSAFNTKTHIQICVRNADCIRGVFRVPENDLAI